MANTHWLTNRGKYLTVTGAVNGAADIYLGLLSGATVPITIDSEAEIQDLNFVSELLALAGVDEPVGGWYARQVCAAITSTEDDTNNRVNMDTGDEVFTAATLGDNICGFFFAKEGGTDAQDQLVSVGTFGPVIPTNGSDLTAVITDLIRAV